MPNFQPAPSPLYSPHFSIRDGRTAILIGIAIALSPTFALAGAPGPEPEPAEVHVDVMAERDVADAPVMSDSMPPSGTRILPPRPILDPAARLLTNNDASEAWTLYIELESGHRITQRFLLTNMGPGEHSAVAVGHLSEPGRAPYRYQNGRRRPRWTLSEDRLFFDIAASHLDLHRPTGELRITKDDIEIRMFFDFAAESPSARVPAAFLPDDYHVEVLAIGAPTRGTIRAPWMTTAVESKGRAWLVHTWTPKDEAQLLARRVEVFGSQGNATFIGLHLTGNGDWESGWFARSAPGTPVIESTINVGDDWSPLAIRDRSSGDGAYPIPAGWQLTGASQTRAITLGSEWLRFDPLDVIPQPFRWYIRRSSKPQEVWAEAQIGGSLLSAPDPPSLPLAGETTSTRRDTETSGSQLREARETEIEAVLLNERSGVTGVASITFLNPMSRR